MTHINSYCEIKYESQILELKYNIFLKRIM